MTLANILSFAFAITLVTATAEAHSVPASPIPPDAEIRKILTERVDNRQSVGIVVGVIEPAGNRRERGARRCWWLAPR